MNADEPRAYCEQCKRRHPPHEHGTDDDTRFCSQCEALTAQRDTAWDALREIETIMRSAGSDSSMLDGIAAVVSNGPLDTAPGGPREDECHRLTVERDQYRDALEHIAENDCPHCQCVEPMTSIARAALSRERKDTNA